MYTSARVFWGIVFVTIVIADTWYFARRNDNGSTPTQAFIGGAHYARNDNNTIATSYY